MRPRSDVVLADDLVTLRPWARADAAELVPVARASYAEISVWLPWCHERYTLAEAEEWVRRTERMWSRKTGYQFVIRSSVDGRLLGACGLNNLIAEHRMGNLGYWVRSDAVGLGVATAATRLVAGFALREAGLSRAEIVVAVGNPASLRVAEKVGAKREGVLRQRLVAGDRTYDAVMFSLLADDLRPA